jgi:hypothetical protein
MAICATAACHTPNASNHFVRILRWTFSRGDQSSVAELCLSADHSAYELRLNPPWNPAGLVTEVFDDAMSAFERQAALERMLVDEGWTLEVFESHHTTRATS